MSATAFVPSTEAIRLEVSRRKLFDRIFVLLALITLAGALLTLLVLFADLVRDGSHKLTRASGRRCRRAGGARWNSIGVGRHLTHHACNRMRCNAGGCGRRHLSRRVRT